jgi:hypothetical protein
LVNLISERANQGPRKSIEENMKHTNLTTADIHALRARYSYDAQTGEFINTSRNNSLVKSPSIKLPDGRRIRTGRAIFSIVTGMDLAEKEIIRYVDGDRMNRAWRNLERSTYREIERPSSERRSLLPHLDFLRECFEYEADSGHLIWKHRPVEHFKTERGQKIFNSRRAGKRAGTRQGSDGRLQLHITSGATVLHCYAAHVVWTLAHGTEVADGLVIDHIDGNRDNERLDNLRLATSAGNSHNSRSKHTAAGMRGVSKNGKKFNVKFVLHNRTQKFVFSRSFEKLQDAKQCRKALEYKYHGQFAYEPVTWTPELQTWIDSLDVLNRANTRGKKTA